MILKSNLNKDFYKPGEIAEFLNVKTRTIQNYCIRGILPERITETGRRLIPHEGLVEYLEKNKLIYDDVQTSKKDILYARVSTDKQKQRGDLDRQIEKLKLYIVDKNPQNLEVITDIASGLNDNRKGMTQLINLILEGKVNRLIIAYKDRLTRFGYNYIKQICEKYNTTIIIVSSEEKDETIEEELAEDIISIIRSTNGKLYKMRKKVKKELDKKLN